MNRNYEYEVERYPVGLSEEEDEEIASGKLTLTEEEDEDEGPKKQPGQIKLEGYTTVFDTKVTLTPVELVPLIKTKK